MARASYRAGLLWIVENDEPDDLDAANISGYISTLLLADLFGKNADDVAAAIVRRRKARDADQRYRDLSPVNA